MRGDRPVLVERLLLGLARGVRNVSATALYTSLGIGALGTAVYFALLVRGGFGHFFVGLALAAWIVGAPVLYAVGIGIAAHGPERRPRLAGLLLGNAVVFAALCGAHLAGSKVISWRLEAWKRNGEEVAAALDAHRDRTGRFPRSLDELPPDTPRPPSRWFQYDPGYPSDGYTLYVRNPRSFIGWDGWKLRSDTHAWERYWD